jgi:hypothetical protein
MFPRLDIDRLLQRQVMHDFTWMLRLETYRITEKQTGRERTTRRKSSWEANPKKASWALEL